MDKVKDYIKHCEDNSLFPNGESFVIYAMRIHNISYKTSTDLLREYKGYIDTHSIAYLKEMIGAGGRNSANYVQLLREYTDKQAGGVSIDQVKIVVDVPLKRVEPTKVKYKGIEVK